MKDEISKENSNGEVETIKHLDEIKIDWECMLTCIWFINFRGNFQWYIYWILCMCSIMFQVFFGNMILSDKYIIISKRDLVILKTNKYLQEKQTIIANG